MLTTSALVHAEPEALAGDDAVAAYGETALAALTSALRGAVSGLVEPRVTDPERAFRVLDRLAETMIGFAIGTIAGELLRVVRIWFGDESAVTARRAFGARWPASDRGDAHLSTTYLPDADANARPLVDALARRLHVGVCLASRDVRTMLEAVRDTIERRAPRRASELRAMFGVLAREETIERRFGEELVFGWQVYTAAVTGTQFPSTDGRWARSQALWEAWRSQLVGRRAPTRTAEEVAGYIMLVR